MNVQISYDGVFEQFQTPPPIWWYSDVFSQPPSTWRFQQKIWLA